MVLSFYIQLKKSKNNQNIQAMKKLIVSLISFCLISSIMMSAKAPSKDTLRITASPTAFSLAESWAEAYSSSNQSVKVSVIMPDGKQTLDEQISRGMLGFVTSSDNELNPAVAGWHTLVGRDVIVPVMNTRNPALNDIMKSGISAEKFRAILKGEQITSGSEEGVRTSFHFYYMKESSIEKPVAAFLGGTDLIKTGTMVPDAASLLTAITNDALAVSFCNLATVADLEKQLMKSNLAIVPIDRNNNSVLDQVENIYSGLGLFLRGVWIGKYPHTLSTGIYAAGIEQPESEAAKAFLRWVLTDGQKLLFENGYSDLLLAERQKAVDQLYEARIYTSASQETKSPFVVLMILAAGVLVLILLADLIIRYVKNYKKAGYKPLPESDKVFSEAGIIVPKGVYFDKAHTWAFMEQDGIVKVGIDDFLQHVTGTITRVRMKKKGTLVQKGEQILSIMQNGKHLDIYAPVSGTITECNSLLETNTGLINASPYNDGWIYRIEPSNWVRENQLLFYADKYRQYLGQEFTRLKDFLAAALAAHELTPGNVVLQDGGEFRDGLLSGMGPEVWEDFQMKYIDPSRQIWFYELF